MNIIILGPAGSGKTTQASLLADFLGIPALNAGDLLFFAAQENNPESQEIREKMKKGELVDSQVIHNLLETHLKLPEHKKGTVLDGHPRTLPEAIALDVIWKVNKVIYLKVSDEEVTRRLLARGREDDSEGVIQRRLEIYHTETEPALEHYRIKGILEEIEAGGTVEEIAQEVQRRLS